MAMANAIGIAMTMARVALSASRHPRAPPTTASLVAAEAEAAHGLVGAREVRWSRSSVWPFAESSACMAGQGRAGRGKGHGGARGGRDGSSRGTQVARTPPATASDGDTVHAYLRWLAGGMKELTIATIHPARRRAANAWLLIARGEGGDPQLLAARPVSRPPPLSLQPGQRRQSAVVPPRLRSAPGRSGRSWRSAALLGCSMPYLTSPSMTV